MKGMTMAAAAAVLAIGLGCGDSGGGSSGGGPSASQTAAAQKAGAAGTSADDTVAASTDAILAAGSNGATSAKSVSGGAQAPSPTFNFQGSVSVVVDFDAQDGLGNDLFPNVQGKLQVDAAGSVSGDPSAGTATYSVQTEWLTDGIFTDPVCGAEATVGTGSGLSYSLTVEWIYTDSVNWSIQAVSDFSAARTVTVTHDGQTWTVTGTVERHATAAITRSAGAFSVVVTVTGNRTVIVSDGVETHTVVIDVQAIDKIFITVDGVTFGPYTALQIRRAWHFDCQP
jgi:hypothetical protein